MPTRRVTAGLPACRELIEKVGVFGLWLREGLLGLTSAGRVLTSEIAALYPRLALLRCVYLQLASKFDGATVLYETVAQETGGFTRDREGGDAEALAVDRVFTQAILAGGACGFLHGALDPLLPAGGTTERVGERARFISGAWHLLRCISCCHRAEFEESRRHGIQAHRRARQGARDFFPADPRLATCLNILLMEVDLERDRGKALQQRTLQGFTDLRGVWNELYAVAVAVRAELAFEQYDSRAVVQFLVRTIEDVLAAPCCGDCSARTSTRTCIRRPNRRWCVSARRPPPLRSSLPESWTCWPKSAAAAGTRK